MYSSKYKSKSLQKGITLIALVVTIVVILILAGVSISMLSGDDGIIISAEKAKEETDNKGVQEQVELMTSEYIMQKNTGGEDSIKKYYQTQASKGEISSIRENNDNTYTITKDGYEVKIDKNGKTIKINEKEKVPVTDIWYKIDGTTLHLSNSDLGGYTKHDESLSYPEWAGTVSNPSDVTKVTFENVVAPTSTKQWFQYMESLTEIEKLENFNTSNTTNMSGMFIQCTSLLSLDLSSFDTSNVTDMSFMFGADTKTMNIQSLNISSFDTSKVTDMMAMFSQCRRLNYIDLNNFNTKNVKNMRMMFIGCRDLKELDLSSFDTGNVSTSAFMFGSNVTCPVYIGEKWTLSETNTSYNGSFQKIIK